MKFEDYFNSHIIPQWKYYYINNKLFDKILNTLRKFQKKTAVLVMEELISSLTEKEYALFK